jgi:hypothetical protein
MWKWLLVTAAMAAGTLRALAADGPPDVRAAMQAPEPRTSIQGLYQQCTGDNAYERYECAGYISASMDSMSIIGTADPGTAFGICPPAGVSVGMGRQVFINWAQKHSDDWSLMRYLGVLYALREAWPCAKPQAQ